MAMNVNAADTNVGITLEYYRRLLLDNCVNLRENVIDLMEGAVGDGEMGVNILEGVYAGSRGNRPVVVRTAERLMDLITIGYAALVRNEESRRRGRSPLSGERFRKTNLHARAKYKQVYKKDVKQRVGQTANEERY